MSRTNFRAVALVTMWFVFQVVTGFHSDDVDGDVGEGRIIIMSTVNSEGIWASKEKEGCCSACPTTTDLYRFSKGSSSPSDTGLCICMSAKQGVMPVSAPAGEGKQWFTGVCGCNSGSHGIPCCPDFAPGDNMREGEVFVQEDQLVDGNCKKTCQTLYSESTGITESTSEKYTNGKNKCWCEFGEPVFQKDKNYQTCIF